MNLNPPLPKTKVRKVARIFKGCTLEVMPVTSADPGIVFNGPSTIWARHFGPTIIGSAHWTPMIDDAHAVLHFKRSVYKGVRLLAAAAKRAAAKTITV